MANEHDWLEQFFKCDHLPPDERLVALVFAGTAFQLLEMLPRNPERTVALRKLLEAKDAALRARVATA